MMQHYISTTPDVAPDTLPVSRWVDLDRVSLRFITNCPAGAETRPTLVLLHEMGGSIETWDRVFALLAPQHRLLAYDWRGAGHSEKVSTPVALEDHVGDLAALLDALHFRTPVVLAACAVGCAIAVAFAARWPERVAGLVLLSPALGVPEGDREARAAIVEAFERDGMRPHAEASLRGGYPERFRSGQEARFAEFRARWLANDPAGFAATYRMLIGLEMAPLLNAVACPAIVVGGEFDPVRTPAYASDVARSIPRAEFVAVPGGHHMPHQIPALVSDLIETFVAKLEPAGWIENAE
jgi:3-oxoadipate enol-lactonase